MFSDNESFKTPREDGMPFAINKAKSTNNWQNDVILPEVPRGFPERELEQGMPARLEQPQEEQFIIEKTQNRTEQPEHEMFQIRETRDVQSYQRVGSPIALQSWNPYQKN